MIYSGRWSAIRRGRGDLPPIVEGLQFFGDLTSSRTSIVSGAVATLGDSSGYNRDFTQGTSTKRPAYNATDAAFGGRPSMTFDGVDDWLGPTAFLDTTLATIYIVFRGGTTGRLWSGGGAPLFLVARSGTGVNAIYFQTGSTTKAATTHATNPVRLAFTGNMGAGSAAIPSMYIDGASAGSYSGTSGTNGTPISTTHAVGGDVGGTSNFNGTIADVLLYSVAHSAAEVAQVDDWLKWRNGL